MTYSKMNMVISCSTKGWSGGCVHWHPGFVVRAGSLNSHVEHVLKRCLLQFDALVLLLQETAAQAARSGQECGQSTNDKRFIAVGGVRWWGCVWASDSHLLNPVHIKPCRNWSSIRSREIAVQGHEMACTSFFWLNLQAKTQQRGWLVPAPPTSSNCSQMDASWRQNDGAWEL